MNPIGVNAWVWVSPPTNESIAELAPRVKAMGFDLFELGLENPGDWDPQRMADVFAANDLSAAVCAAMGPGRDLTDPVAVDSTRDYLRACIDAVAALGGKVVDRLDSPAVGVMLDTFHMNIEEKDQAAAIRLVGDKLVHFHACGNDRGAPGSDHIAWDAIDAALRETGYDGALVIESFTPDNQTIARAAAIWRPLAETQDALAQEGLAFLRQTIA